MRTVLVAMAKPNLWNPQLSDVARWIGCSRSAVRERLAHLVGPGLVERVDTYRWAITPKGRQYLLDVAE